MASPVFTPQTPHFFKVILQEDIQDGILGVPTNFAGKYGNQLPSIVKLEVPSGQIWPVKLEKSTDGSVLLQKGWREFAEYYSLDLGSFLVFRYEGNGHFHVLIFEKTATEIEYPYTSTDDATATADDDVDDDDDEDDDDDDDTEYSPRPELPSKKMRTDSQVGRGTSSASHSKFVSRDGVVGEIFSCSQKLRRAERAQAIRRASAFKSRENPDFMVIMQPSYLCKRYRMGLPSEFAKEYMQMRTCDLTLTNSSGKTWPMRYYSNAPQNNNQLQPHIRDGWKAFVVDNHLAAGDICVFELIKQQPQILMKVLIIRKSENAAAGHPVSC